MNVKMYYFERYYQNKLMGGGGGGGVTHISFIFLLFQTKNYKKKPQYKIN